MRNYIIRYMAVALAAILLVAGSTRAFALANRAGGVVSNLRTQIQAQVSSGFGLNDPSATVEPTQATETAEPTETQEPTETAAPTETAEPTETAAPTQGEDQNDDNQGQDQDSDDQEAIGTVEQITDTAWTISGQVVMINGDTEIGDGIVVGSIVKYEFVTNPDGSITATEIKLSENHSSGGDQHQGSGGSDNGGQQGGGDDSGGGSGGGSGSGGGDDGGGGGGGGGD